MTLTCAINRYAAYSNISSSFIFEVINSENRGSRKRIFPCPDSSSTHFSRSLLFVLLQREPANTDLLYIKGMSMKCLQQYEEAITAYQHALRLRSDDARILSGIGEVYVIEAREMAEKNTAKVGTQAYIRSHQAQRKLYNQALPHLEKARTLDADNTTLWYNNLREVYYKLYKGKELKELEK